MMPEQPNDQTSYLAAADEPAGSRPGEDIGLTDAVRKHVVLDVLGKVERLRHAAILPYPAETG